MFYPIAAEIPILLFKIIYIFIKDQQNQSQQLSMYSDNHEKNQQISILPKEQLEIMSPEQRQFAEQQFRLMYVQQMSKLTMELSHKKRVLDNLQTLDEQSAKNLKQQYDKLKNKLAANQTKRNKKLQQKVKQCKLNDERWAHKMKEIQSKFKQQNRQALEKAKKYRQQSQNYWKQKKSLQNSIKQSKVTKNKRESLDDNNLHNSTIKSAKNVPLKNYYTKRSSYQPSHKQFQRTSHEELQQQIKIHKQRSLYLQKQKEEQIFKKAAEKLQKINKKREQVQKKNQKKVLEPTVPRKINDRHVQKSKRNRHNSLANNNDKKQGLKHSKHSIDKLIKDHIEIKHKIDEQQFYYRGQKLEQQAQKTRKEKIMKMLKNRINQMKKQVIKNETLQNNS